MHNDYRDIREKIPIDPLWWDEDGVPRYCDFTPDECGHIYAEEVVLLLIACQNCQHQFKVCMSLSKLEVISHRYLPEDYTLAQTIENETIHYGDPPNIRCCPAGPTMNCEDLKVLEYWHMAKDSNKWREWVRRPELEIDLPGFGEIELPGEIDDLPH